MEKQIKETVLFVLLTISALKNYISCMEISSQIVFDSRENEGNSNDFSLRDFLNLNEVHDQIATAQQILKSFTFKINSENELRMLNTKRSDFIGDDSLEQPVVINNIQITVNGNGTKSTVDVCKNGICNVSVSSRLNDEGDIITNVRLTIATKLKTDFKKNDIPIVDGIRGIENTYNHLNRSRPLLYLYKTIPQIQSRYQGGEPWYQNRRSIEKPEVKPVVDDKIDPPFSKTQSNEE
ncbi:uncharacterized protein LOC122531805 [Frieseomelitta varia]|uniref:uncharacterized protein LOC122531805 n=1 Tax=Frieseomelitta varia TaxID=561572 RepID=UPI001CB696D6|nr:uncharacterized protein LOC122531805 [Frieseomelitta varia]